MFGNRDLRSSPGCTALNSLVGPSKMPKEVKMGFFEDYLLDVMTESMDNSLFMFFYTLLCVKKRPGTTEPSCSTVKVEVARGG